MAGMGAGTRRLCVAYDVEQYSQSGTRREYATQERLSHVLSSGLKIEVCRLREAGPVREALAASSAPLMAVVADGLYCDVLSQGYHGGSTDPGTPGGDGQPRAQRFLDSKDAW